MSVRIADEAARVFADPSAYADEARLHAAMTHLRAHAPVSWVDVEGYRPFWAITKHADIMAIERDNAVFTNSPRPVLTTAEGDAQQEAWCTIQRGHAIANGVFVAAINRVGHEGPDAAGLDFWGQSFLCDPSGRLLVVGSVDRDEVLLARCNRGLIEQQRRGWPFLRDRRIDTYKELTARWLDTPTGFTSEPNGSE